MLYNKTDERQREEAHCDLSGDEDVCEKDSGETDNANAHQEDRPAYVAPVRPADVTLPCLRMLILCFSGGQLQQAQARWPWQAQAQSGGCWASDCAESKTRAEAKAEAEVVSSNGGRSTGGPARYAVALSTYDEKRN